MLSLSTTKLFARVLSCFFFYLWTHPNIRPLYLYCWRSKLSLMQLIILLASARISARVVPTPLKIVTPSLQFINWQEVTWYPHGFIFVVYYYVLRSNTTEVNLKDVLLYFIQSGPAHCLATQFELVMLTRLLEESQDIQLLS